MELVTAQAGKPYVWGGKGPNEFDCSGLIYWALKQLGINYGGNSTAQWGMVERISESELKPGDLIFYGANASRHVSVYISPGKCFEAKSPSEGIGYGNYKAAGDICGYGRIKELSDGASGAAKAGLEKLEAVLGQNIYNGECYGLTAYYVDQVGGPKLMGSGKMYAWSIGTDYDWGAHGWQVILNPEYKDLQPGDVINWYGGGAISPGSYGHTGIIISVNGNGTFSTYEQNAEQGRVCAKYTRNLGSARIASIVRKK
ncbi:CHAP domain-containing protein [Enterococcus sp. AZ196]|uniref:CHAP domain-containing protein n=1 Tax=Enterococcus sp. AZ196 TaxID=2774659 RepID=UPI003D2940B7